MYEIYQNISSLIFIYLKLHHELLIARNNHFLSKRHFKKMITQIA